MKTPMVKYRRGDVLEVLRSLEMIVVSLDRIGSATAQLPRAEQASTLLSFVDRWDVFRKLAAARRILSKPFSSRLGPDLMDELVSKPPERDDADEAFPCVQR